MMMPSRSCGSADTAATLKERCLGAQVLETEERRMKFKEHIIIRCKLVDRDQIF